MTHRLTMLRPALPGLALCAVATVAALAVNSVVSGLSPLLLAIVMGAVSANLGWLPARGRPGLAVASTTVLRVGVALLGFKLGLGDVLGLGWQVIVVVVTVVVLGVVGTLFVGHLLGLGWTQRVLIACGFSVCGAAAVAAVDGVIDADEEEVVTAVALVVIFGTLMIGAVPLLAAAIGLSCTQAGAWAGAAVHEVAQVVAAGGAIGGSALGVAVVVKLARVLMLAPVVTALSVRQRRLATGVDGARRPPLVPAFILAFLACVLVRSTGLLGPTVLEAADLAQTALLTAAMFALGTGVQLALLRRVGARPFVLALLSTLWVSGIALAGVLVAGITD